MQIFTLLAIDKKYMKNRWIRISYKLKIDENLFYFREISM